MRIIWVVSVQTSDKRRTLQRPDSTDVGLANVGLVQTSEWFKRRTGTNVGLVQTSDWYKRRTGENLGLVQT